MVMSPATLTPEDEAEVEQFRQDLEDAFILDNLQLEHGELPQPEAAVDHNWLNRIAGILSGLQESVDDLTAQARHEKEAIDLRMAKKVNPIVKQLEFLQARYHQAFEAALDETIAGGKSKSLKLLFATIKRKPVTYKGQFVPEGVEYAVVIARKTGLESIIKPEETVVYPESVGWGDLKKCLEFETEKNDDGMAITKIRFKDAVAAKRVPLSLVEVEDGMKLVAIDKALGESVELATIERSGGDLDIKLEVKL